VERTEQEALVRKMSLKIAVGVLIWAAVPLIAAGRLDWWIAWVYGGVFTACVGLSTWLLVRTSPGLMAERARIGKGVKRWDLVLVPLMASVLPILTLVVSGLDERFGWSPEPHPILALAGLTAMVLGHLLFHWAMATNEFFSGVVRIQEERGHHVITGGPYCYVRHPGYVGVVLFFLPIPLVLGSLWAWIPAGVGLCVTLLRTALEDRTLRKELAGYEQYARKVRYRLLPGIW